jgi:hypothetical protein
MREPRNKGNGRKAEGGPVLLICAEVTVRSIRPPVAGAMQRTCGECGSAVWMSPASLRAVVEMDPGFKIICIACASGRMRKGGEGKVMALSEGQIEELRVELERRAAL